jgi:hypothetical protein
MPRARRARDKRSRARKSGRGYDTSLLLEIEEPLREATHYVEALRLIGHGLELHDETGGHVVAALARLAALRLRAVEDVWNNALEAK